MAIDAAPTSLHPSSHSQVRRPAAAIRSRSLSVAALITIVLTALGLRLYAINWDGGLDLHPDELYLAKNVLIQRISVTWPPQFDNLLDPERSGLNPRSADPNTGELREYPYGALPLLVTDTVATILGWLTGENWNASDRAYLVGRALSALLDTLTVIVVYLIGARAFSIRVGLFAAIFAALAPMSIQLAHFFTSDAWLTCFVALTIYTSVRAAESGLGRWFAAAGLCLGLAMATKGSVFALAGLIGAAIVYDVWRRWRDDRLVSTALFAVPKQFAVSVIAALVGFALFEPYALLRREIYVQSLRTQAAIAGGTFDIPFTRVFIGTVPVVYQLEQFIRWGFGPVAGTLAVAGVFGLARRFWRAPSAGQWIMLCWLLGYGVVISIAETKFLRYLSPLVPALALTAALALDALIGATRTRFGPRFAVGVLGALLVGAGLWTAAFLNVYAAEHPRLAASQWIYDNVPSGSTLSWEYWDDRLPKPLGPGLNEEDYQYQFLSIDLYADRPPEEVADALYDTLDQLDYVVISSDRIAAAIPRSPWRYPVQNRILDLLHSGQLGFTQVAEFHVTPGLGPFHLDDRDADESFINYDHPRVTIFAKDGLVSRADYDLLLSWALDQPWSPTRQAERPSLLLDQPVGDLPIVDDSRWSAELTDNSLAALAVWIVLLIVFQAIGWPLAAFLFDRFGDAGWGLARLLVLLISGYVVWLGASLRWIEFRAVWAWIAVIALGLATWLLRRRWPFHLTLKQRQARIGTELVFWVVFAVFLLLRYLNPDGWHPVWGGEKPMEFAHLNATLRSAHFPPYDPWFADGYINYYYYGLYLIAFCLKLTGLPSEIGFNLAQPTIIALLASSGYSVAATLGRDLSRQARLAIPAGVLGVVLLLAIGNLTSLGRLLSSGQQDFGSFVDWVWAGSRAIQGAITEFPFFTALYADLHAHVIALPITVLTIGLAYAVARDRRGPIPVQTQHQSRSSRLAPALRLIVLALVLGTLFPTNAWDVPVYAALAIASIWMGFRGITDWRVRIAWSAATSLLVALGAYLFFRPFHEHYVALFGSLDLVRAPMPLTEATSHIGGLVTIAVLGLVLLILPRRAAGPWPVNQPARTAALLALGLLVANLADRIEPAIADSVRAVFLVAIAAVSLVVIWTEAKSLRRHGLQWWTLVIVEGAVFLLAMGALGLGQPVLAGYLIVVGLAFALWLTAAAIASRFVALLILAAASTGAGSELVFVADDLIGTTAYRMNSIFKFYNQIWVLLAIAGAALVTRMLFDSRWLHRTPNRAGIQLAGTAARVGWARAGLVVTTLLIGGSLFYPLLATFPRLSQRFEPGLGSGTLNALDWMETGTLDVIGGDGLLSFAGDRAAVDWLNRNIAGSPVIAEASIGPYRCNGSRISVGTGLPTIIGWERHQQQQRDRKLLPERVADVRTLYTSEDPAEKEAVLRKYNVEYVIVGGIERDYIVPNGNDCQATGSDAGIEAFETMAGSDLETVFTEGQTVIYRVLPVNEPAVAERRGTGQ